MFVATGSLMWGLLVLAAPLPMQLVRMSDYETWSVGEILRARRDDPTVSDALDQALRGPLPTRPAVDDDLFLPDCPRLDAPPLAAERPATPPASTPLR